MATHVVLSTNQSETDMMIPILIDKLLISLMCLRILITCLHMKNLSFMFIWRNLQTSLLYCNVLKKCYC